MSTLHNEEMECRDVYKILLLTKSSAKSGVTKGRLRGGGVGRTLKVHTPERCVDVGDVSGGVDLDEEPKTSGVPKESTYS